MDLVLAMRTKGANGKDASIYSFLSLSENERFRTEVLVVCFLLSFYVQQTVPVPQFGHALGTHGNLGVLAVLHQSVADAVTAADTTWGARTAHATRGT